MLRGNVTAFAGQEGGLPVINHLRNLTKQIQLTTFSSWEGPLAPAVYHMRLERNFGALFDLVQSASGVVRHDTEFVCVEFLGELRAGASCPSQPANVASLNCLTFALHSIEFTNVPIVSIVIRTSSPLSSVNSFGGTIPVPVIRKQPTGKDVSR